MQVWRPDSHERVVWLPSGSRSESRIKAGMRGSNDSAYMLPNDITETKSVACYGTDRSNTGTRGKERSTRLHA